MSKPYRLTLCSDVDYEEMVIDVVFKDRKYAGLTVTQELGTDHMEVEIMPALGCDIIKYPLDDLISALKEAKQKLIAFEESRET